MGDQEPQGPRRQAPHRRGRAVLSADRLAAAQVRLLPGDRRRAAVIVTSTERARSLPQPPVYVRGAAEEGNHRNILGIAGAVISSRSSGMLILVKDSAESILPADLQAQDLTWFDPFG
jgi:hypothetical protein